MNSSIILKEGYRLKFMGTHVLVACPTEQPYLIELASIKPGEEIPRDTDEPMEWDI